MTLLNRELSLTKSTLGGKDFGRALSQWKGVIPLQALQLSCIFEGKEDGQQELGILGNIMRMFQLGKRLGSKEEKLYHWSFNQRITESSPSQFLISTSS